ncbi:MAG: hypothetical protein CMI02_06540 [Oceanospirillaceae bacterium]|nr:hypothetical protein [Oceanospirillaceae bacterium]MBT11674.1 hypothetical protein [Oceanospirillaceae bacterium]|tara:strand:+ start:11100 stop:12926 length:1827 start_codon:yes stop_codon:yes gene_type:complete
MKQWIRWSGLISFVVITALLAVFFIIAAGPLAKMAIESVGSDIAGAKVEAGSVSLTLNPIGFEIEHLTVADAEQPMQNLLQFSRATAELEFVPLLLGKAIIRELSVDGLEFDTARETSGALEEEISEETVAADDSDSGTDQDKLPFSVTELPSAQEILAREPLQTESAGDAFEQSYKQHKADIDEAVKKVPDSEALASYEDELNRILSGRFDSLEDFKARKKELDALKERMKADRDAVKAAQRAVTDAREDLGDKLTALKNAPGDDLSRIKNKYQLNAQGAANLTALLFGSEAGEWAGQALYWYEKVEPYLSSGNDDAEGDTPQEPERIRDGRFVHFPTDDPWPEFLLRKARLTASVPAGELLISMEDLTHQPAVLGRPAHILLNGSGLHDVQDLSVDIVLDHRKKPANDTLTLTAKDWHLKGMNLGLGGTELDSAMVQVQGLAVVSGGKLSAQSDMQFGQTRFTGEGKTLFAKELTRALQSINQFDVNAKASGGLKSPQVELGSDLDSRLSEAFNQRLNEKQRELEQKLQARLQEKLQSYTGEYADELAQLNAMDGSLNDKLNSLQAMNERKLEDYEAQKKREAEEKAAAKREQLKDKAKDKLKSLF